MTDPEQRPGMIGKNSHGPSIRPGAPATQAREKPACIVAVERDTHMARQQRFGRLQAGQTRIFVHGFELRQRDAALHANATGVDAAQEREMRPAAQRRPDVFTEGTDVGALAARHYYLDRKSTR